MPRAQLAMCWVALCASASSAQPVWRLDVSGAESGTLLYCDSQATALGNPGCGVRDYQPLVVSDNKLVPGFEYLAETFSFGAIAASIPQAVGVGTGTTTADSTAVVGIGGDGTAQVVVYFRAVTNHSTTQTACGYRAGGHTEINAAIPLEIDGPAGAAYRVGYQWEYSASAATPYEAVAPNWPEDGIICQGGIDVTCPIDPSARLCGAGFTTGYHPERTSAPVTGSGTLEVSPGWSGGGAYPARRPIVFASIGAVVDDVMTNPAPAAVSDSCSGEFSGRVTLTIQATIPSGGCCRSGGCLVTTQRACATTFAGSYRGDNTACANPINQISLCCPADVNGTYEVTVQDLFDFLAAYFAAGPQGDFNASGAISVQDIFDFLAAYFTGC
ncbi:MAG: hypothetical protein IT438_10740 [Phycisphaerales bacterium]|nr:hypothetical protein [Phycisphaerales bacterium]